VKCTDTLDVFAVFTCEIEGCGADRSIGKRGLTGKATYGQYMSIDVAHLLSLDGGSVHEHAEFQHFIRSRDVAGTKTDNTNGHHCKNATAIHDFTPQC